VDLSRDNSRIAGLSTDAGDFKLFVPQGVEHCVARVERSVASESCAFLNGKLHTFLPSKYG
jgi:hypothetical protein